MNQLMQMAHEAGLEVATTSVGMAVIIPTKNGKLCSPEDAVATFAAKISLGAVSHTMEEVRDDITKFQELLAKDLENAASQSAKDVLKGAIEACITLKEHFT